MAGSVPSPSPSPGRPTILQSGAPFFSGNSKTLDRRNWPDVGYAAAAQPSVHRGCWGPCQEPELAFPLWGHLLGRAIGPPELHMVTWAALSSGAGPCLGSSWRKARVWPTLSGKSGPSCCFWGLRKHQPISQLPPLARRPQCWPPDHLMDAPGNQGPDRSIASCSPALPPAARRLGPQGLWGRLHRKGPALCDCRVFSVKPPAPSANPCVLLSPEQNVNRHLKAKGIEYLFYP